MLARREYSVSELRRKLEGKYTNVDDIDAVVRRLVDEGMVCDRRFAEAFVRSRIARWQGPRKIRAELLRRGVAQGDIHAALDSNMTSWTDLAAEWLLRQGRLDSDYETRAKFYRRLANRGFTHDQAMDALNRVGSGADGV